MKNIAIISATVAEYRHCRDILALASEKRCKGRLVASGGDERVAIFLLHGGIGKINSASATQLAIDEFQPDLVIDVGAAGSLQAKNDIGTVVCGRCCFEYDLFPLEKFSHFAHDLTTATLLEGETKDKVDVMSEFAAHVQQAGLAPSLLVGDIACGEQDVSDSATRERLYATFAALACDWETAAVLKVAAWNDVASLSFRVVTDRADENMAEDYRTNLHLSLDKLARVLQTFLHAGWLDRLLV
jgi:adenosylhomocysteine nucleosidase